MKHKILLFATLYCILVLSAPACTSTAERITDNQERASSIIQALSNYEQDYGCFPEQLDALIPTYLEEIPETTVGQNFVYVLESQDSYYIIFDVPGKRDLSCRYIHRWDSWDCSYGDS